MPRALTIAGSDSGGGAGIQADLKTFLALGVHGMSAVTALTAQNTLGVSEVHAVPASFVREQIAQVATDIGVDAAKTGMLWSSEIVAAVADAVAEFGIAKLVVDPVLSSKDGHRLLSEKALGTLRERLFSLALIVTPNLAEATALTGREVGTLDDMREAAKALRETGAAHVLVTGGHLEGRAIDVLFDGVSWTEFSADRIDTKKTHGTGCVHSAAIAAYLARGERLVEAVGKAKSFTTAAIRGGLDLGGGWGPVNPPLPEGP